MKKSVALLAVVVLSIGSLVNAQSFSTVLDWMYDNGLTKYDTETEFRGDNYITRGEISKFFAKFAEVQGLDKTRSASECQFNDIEGYDYTLVPTIIEACQYGLVKGFNNNYMPNNNLTEAEALTVVIRALMGVQDESKNPRWFEYHAMGEWLGILDGETLWGLDTPSTRATVGTWLYRAANVDTTAAQEEGTDELKDILEEIFGDNFFDE